MLNEPTVKKIMTHYFKLKGIKAVLQAGPGPDFLEAGQAIEIKGTDSNFEGAIEQFIDYLFTGKYKGLSVAFPHDLIDVGKLARFTALCEAATAINRPIPVYIVAGINDSYHVRLFGNGREVWTAFLQQLSQQYSKIRQEYYKIRHDPNALARRAREEFMDIDRTLQENLRQLIQAKSDRILKSLLSQ